MREFKAVLSAFMCLAVLVLFTGCKDKTVITIDDFKSKMEDKGYVTTVGDDSSSDLYTYCEAAKDEDYSVVFFDFKELEEAKKAFDEAKSSVDEASVKIGAVSVSAANYSKYSLTADGEYIVLTRVEKTMLWVQADKQYKSEIKDIIDELGY